MSDFATFSKATAEDTTTAAEEFTLADPNKWNPAAVRYDDAVGRSSRAGAAQLIQLADALHSLSTTPNSRAIDLGAGTGSLTHRLATYAPDLPI